MIAEQRTLLPQPSELVNSFHMDKKKTYQLHKATRRRAKLCATARIRDFEETRSLYLVREYPLSEIVSSSG